MKTLFFILLFASTATFAQELKDITFNEPTHDFGSIKEIGGSVEFDFVFKNTGTEPIKILDVEASCGCTTPAWTKVEVAPGGNGFIKASFDPINRPGPFHKTLTVSTSSAQNNAIILHISGQVEPKPRTVEDDLPTLLGGIRLKYRIFNMGKVFNNDFVTKEFDVYNASGAPVIFAKEFEGPDYIEIEFLPETLAPKEKGKIIISYDGKGKNDLGFMSENIVFSTNEEGEIAQKSMSVYADVQEYFPPMTEEEKLNAPKLSVENAVHNFGDIASGAVVSTTFVLTNSGKTDLNIRKTKASCGCTVPHLVQKDLKPGESVDLKVTFNSAGRKGTQIKTVTIYSNDPMKPIQKVTVKSRVAKQ
ncbi:MAG: DUF1573 domain-containing protein [Cyclobacteriaceae bacterium]|nr:DUF1573 domain-containing protein [Cyclobacteriaceae bacterium]